MKQGLRNKPVPKPADRNDMLRALFIIFDFAAQTVDVDHDRIVINGDGIAPDMFIDHIFGEYLLWVLHKEKKECAFFGRKEIIMTKQNQAQVISASLGNSFSEMRESITKTCFSNFFTNSFCSLITGAFI